MKTEADEDLYEKTLDAVIEGSSARKKKRYTEPSETNGMRVSMACRSDFMA
jgi:hypothetical protein